ncbi:hypothetical protein FA95DRAFT_1559383 [Auriscalpium vulgare]|uniref:Uncharacterized protein n=1 Tax=Auriscalpium vulgare TaxID=40419 RepID=A0ACB8RTN9_9AGAM|nr:hypothetical protein FA95DRAFT_1559383 [Auriscalpium vulgare]
MASTADAAAALKLEIARLTGAINQRKSAESQPRSKPISSSAPRPFKNTYVNPSYKPPSRSYVRPSGPPSTSQATMIKPTPTPSVRQPPGPSQPRDVTIGGVTFESSSRSLVRKDLPKPAATTKPVSSGPRPQVQPQFIRNHAGHPKARPYKPKGPSRRALNRNMTLNNTRRSYQSVWSRDSCMAPLPNPNPRSRRTAVKKFDKPCARFTTTGACNRGLTCLYQHDPAKIAVCWPFLQGTCPHSADTCALSHDATPNRTPLCVHFANHGRCTRVNCPFPHVNVGQRSGVCRDFAVLGYCERGLDCDKQHVRECPDFAEKGECPNKKCKLPHVIRANRRRPPVAAAPSKSLEKSPGAEPIIGSALTDPLQPAAPLVSAQDAQLGDEFISLTFVESESDEEENDDDEEDDESEDDDEEEGDSPSLDNEAL